MEKKFCGIVLLLLLLLTHELMVQSEARNCYSRSRAYHGRCFFRNHVSNCKQMCKEEQFTAGTCIRGTCYCSKTCGSEQDGAHNTHSPPAAHSGDDDDDGGDDGDA
ncbi:hypothetical protein ABFX02_10G125900 [Erythranthe guttata]